TRCTRLSFPKLPEPAAQGATPGTNRPCWYSGESAYAYRSSCFRECGRAGHRRVSQARVRPSAKANRDSQSLRHLLEDRTPASPQSEMHEKAASRETRRRQSNLPIQRTTRGVICDSCQESSVQRFGTRASSGLTALFCGSSGLPAPGAFFLFKTRFALFFRVA